ncbi:MAG: DUF4136 domain-containing protein [bacterium]
MHVYGHWDAELDYGKYKRFATVLPESETPLVYKQILHLVELQLTANGYVLDEGNPDFLIIPQYFVGSYEVYKPPVTIPLPVYKPGQRTRTHGWIGTQMVTVTQETAATVEFQPATVRRGHVETEFYKVINLYFADADYLSETDSLRLIWRGVVTATGALPDIVRDAPPMLQALLKEFPYRRYYDLYRYYLDPGAYYPDSAGQKVDPYPEVD